MCKTKYINHDSSLSQKGTLILNKIYKNKLPYIENPSVYKKLAFDIVL